MKVVVCGKSFIACNTVRYLFDVEKVFKAGFGLAIVSTTSDPGVDTWEPSLKRTADLLALEKYEHYTEVPFAEGDILLSVQYDKIIRTTALNGAQAFNVHFSKLPQYRGCFPSVLPLRNGETHAGVSLHVLTDGIDDGPVIDQAIFDLPDFITSYELYRLYNSHGYELVKDNLQSLLDGSFMALAQDDGAATYFNRKAVEFSNREIEDFNQPCVKIRNFIRSLIFPPYQIPTFRGKGILCCDIMKWKVPYDMKWSESSVVYEDASHAVVRCQDGYLRLEFDTHGT
jgi:methionyl-tRNA formyltransferase